MKVIDILKRSSIAFPSLEFVPPLKGGDINKLYQSLEPLMEFRPPFMNITCHRDDRVGDKIITKRPGTVAIAAAVMKRFRIEVVPHMICAYSNRYEHENELIDLSFLDIDNIMALRGDMRGADGFVASDGGYSHTVELVRQISNLNGGRYIDDDISVGVHTHFCIGVAGYPEKHAEASTMDEDIEHLKEKVDAGADYIITQMFFDNKVYYDFVDLCRAKGITVPIIPGLKPISMKSHIEKLPQSFALHFPKELVSEVDSCRDDSQVYDLGIEWAVAQSRDLIAHGAPAVHYYTMGRAANIIRILSQVF